VKTREKNRVVVLYKANSCNNFSNENTRTKQTETETKMSLPISFNQMASAAPKPRLVPVQYGMSHQHTVYISSYWQKQAAKPAFFISSLAPGVYHLSIYGNSTAVSDRKQLWHAMIELFPIKQDELNDFRELVDPRPLERYSKSHFTISRLPVIGHEPIDLASYSHSAPVGGFSSLTVCIVAEQPGPIGPDLSDLPAASVAVLPTTKATEGEPVLVLMDVQHRLLASTMTQVTHGGDVASAGRLKVTPIGKRVWDRKQERKFLPSPDKVQIGVELAEKRKHQLFHGTRDEVRIDSQTDQINRYEMAAAYQDQLDYQQKIDKQQKMKTDSEAHPEMHHLPVDLPAGETVVPGQIDSAVPVTRFAAKLAGNNGQAVDTEVDADGNRSNYQAVMLALDMRMKLNRMEKEVIIAYGAFVVVAVAVFIRLLGLL
jgi:hypothetical protein